MSPTEAAGELSCLTARRGGTPNTQSPATHSPQESHPGGDRGQQKHLPCVKSTYTPYNKHSCHCIKLTNFVFLARQSKSDDCKTVKATFASAQSKHEAVEWGAPGHFLHQLSQGFRAEAGEFHINHPASRHLSCTSRDLLLSSVSDGLHQHHAGLCLPVSLPPPTGGCWKQVPQNVQASVLK